MRAVIARGVFNPYHEEKKGFDIVIQVLPNATCVHSLTRQGRIALEKIRRGERDVFSFFPKVWLMLSFAEDQAITFLHVNIPGMKIV
ncbi:MAG: hypothetical protein NTV36_01915 [Candidatus Staskawiczbacteria bacterium]|nr:hypothetical protein [Candidatus Staskawiczbacteria bacterium]